MTCKNPKIQGKITEFMVKTTVYIISIDKYC